MRELSSDIQYSLQTLPTVRCLRDDDYLCLSTLSNTEYRVFISPSIMAAARVLQLNSGWYWKERNSADYESVVTEVPEEPRRGSSWAPAQQFPSEIHVELMKSGRIPDPFVGFNEHQVQCTSAVCCTEVTVDVGCFKGSDTKSGCTTAHSLDLWMAQMLHMLTYGLKVWTQYVTCTWCA